MNAPAAAVKPPSSSVGLSLPPGPPLLSGISNLRALRKDALSFLRQMRQQHGGVCRFYIGYIPITFVTEPDAVRHVLQENHKNYNKQTRGFMVLRELLGNGLLTSEGSFWLRQRRLAQPAFHRARLAAFAKMMQDATAATAGDWTRRGGAPFELTGDMMKLTLIIVSRALFGTDLGPAAAVIDEAFSATLEYAKDRLTQLVMLPRWIPTPGNMKANAALQKLDEVVFDLINKRRKDGEVRHDLLAMLMEAKDEDTGERMTDQQLRDEVMTLMLAGHETSANALSWTFALLSRNPGARTKLEAEVDAVLGKRTPEVEDLMKLPYTRAVLDEAMRLYPPAWSFSRSPEADDVLGGYRVAKGSIVLMSSYVTQHDEKLYPNPFAFEPERFLNATDKTHPRFSYYPFGGGPRLCIGSNFALMEMTIVVAMLTQKFRVELQAGQELLPDALITLRPKNGLRVSATLR